MSTSPTLFSIDNFGLLLYTVYLGGIIGGIWILRRSSGKQRIWGLALLFESALATILLTAMSTKYWSEEGIEIIGINIRPMIWSAASVIIPLSLGIAVVVGVGYAAIRLRRGRYPVIGGLLPCFLIPVIFAASSAELISLTEHNRPEVTETPSKSEIKVSPGFGVSVFKKDAPLQNPTSIIVGPDNNLYVANFNGDIWGISSEDGSCWKYATGFHIPSGLAWHDDLLYVASQGKVSIVHDENGDKVGDTVEDIITDLPAGIYHFHANNGLAFGSDNRLYFAVGSTSDSSVETYQYAASVLSAEADGSDLRVVATGVRNPYRLAFNSNGDLFATENGPNELEKTPGDELNLIVQGGDYGYPTEFGIPQPGSTVKAPVALFPPHASADGLVFYHGDQFPQEYYDNAFVTLLHLGEVYRIQLTRDAGGNYVARNSLFITGLGAPVDLVVGPDGGIYVIDFMDSLIYKVSYTGEN